MMPECKKPPLFIESFLPFLCEDHTTYKEFYRRFMTERFLVPFLPFKHSKDVYRPNDKVPGEKVVTNLSKLNFKFCLTLFVSNLSLQYQICMKINSVRILREVTVKITKFGTSSAMPVFWLVTKRSLLEPHV